MMPAIPPPDKAPWRGERLEGAAEEPINSEAAASGTGSTAAAGVPAPTSPESKVVVLDQLLTVKEAGVDKKTDMARAAAAAAEVLKLAAEAPAAASAAVKGNSNDKTSVELHP